MVYVYKAYVKGVRTRSMNADDVINAHLLPSDHAYIRGVYLLFFKKSNKQLLDEAEHDIN